MMLNKYPEIMEPKDVGKVLKVSEKTVIKMLKRGDIKHIRVGKFYRILKEDLEVYLYKNRSSGPPE